MFYCEDCRIERDWPTSLVSSYGPCECCGKKAHCHDRPAGSLPAPLPSTELPTIKQEFTSTASIKIGGYTISNMPLSSQSPVMIWLENDQGEGVGIDLNQLWKEKF